MAKKLSSEYGKLVLLAQLLEEGVKQYCIKVFDKLKEETRDKVVLKFKEDYFDRLSFRLRVNLFKNLSNNEVLINNIEKAIDLRNRYIHKEFSFMLNYENEKELAKKSKKIKRNIHNDIILMKNTLENLIDEIEKIKK